jgi:hypothetical protein
MPVKTKVVSEDVLPNLSGLTTDELLQKIYTALNKLQSTATQSVKFTPVGFTGLTTSPTAGVPTQVVDIDVQTPLLVIQNQGSTGNLLFGAKELQAIAIPPVLTTPLILSAPNSYDYFSLTDHYVSCSNANQPYAVLAWVVSEA